ncbi:MAG: flagellar hook-length control protein FliK [Candidatus Puniceispirillaceae bacterium]
MFAGIFMMLNAESVAQTEAGQFGMEQGAKEEQGVQEDMSGERSPEETAALVSAMIQPSANKKVGGGNASADPAGRLAAIAEDLKARQDISRQQSSGIAGGAKTPAHTLSTKQGKAGFELSSALADDAELADTEILPQQDIVLKKAARRPRSSEQAAMVSRDADKLFEKPAEAAQTLTASKLKADKGMFSTVERAETGFANNNTAERTSSQTRTAATVEAGQTLNNQAQMNGNNGQSGHQGGNGAAAGARFDNSLEQWADMLDMQDDNWSEMLVRRIDKEFRGGGKGLEIEMSPRHLGRLQVTLTQQQEQTHINMRTENSSAALMLIEAEARLSQMLESSGLKLGMFNAFSDGRGNQTGQQNDGGDRQQNTASSDAGAGEEDGEEMLTANEKNDETIVNIRA